jgi:hypothetical protein
VKRKLENRKEKMERRIWIVVRRLASVKISLSFASAEDGADLMGHAVRANLSLNWKMEKRK